MKILVKPIAVILLGAYSFALGQNVNLFFSDPVKQLKFEEKRIYINEVNEKEMRISGGAQFNYLAFLNSSQPLYLPDEIKTEYAYINEFDIIQNGRILTEIEFLEIIGLPEKSRIFLRGIRLLPPRAGITAMTFWLDVKLAHTSSNN